MTGYIILCSFFIFSFELDFQYFEFFDYSYSEYIEPFLIYLRLWSGRLGLELRSCHTTMEEIISILRSQGCGDSISNVGSDEGQIEPVILIIYPRNAVI